ncbi:disulfide bond formation protein B, partial [Klebsiella pneumoniae]|uniref:disulfide bond formation protein B n=1 Tax=Klebsiella pneumoniae TaxID=573 RepID=UPI003904DD8C
MFFVEGGARLGGRGDGEEHLSPLAQARLIALVAPSALLGGAFASQYIGGLYPCEMCWWQRYPHEA